MPLRRIASAPDLHHRTLPVPSPASKVSTFARSVFDEILKPAGIGVLSGASMLFLWKTTGIVVIYSIVFIAGSFILLSGKKEEFIKAAANSDHWIHKINDDVLDRKPSNLIQSCIKAPLIEEAFFRGIALDSFKWVAVKIFPHQKINLIWCRVKLSTLVSHTATALWFGVGHYRSRGIVTVIYSIFYSIGLGILKEKYGIVSSISAHMTINYLVR